MVNPVAFHRELGTGVAILCIHCGSSSSSQWRPLMDRLASSHRVIAVDIYGHGKSASWPNAKPLTVNDEVRHIEPLMAAEPEFHLVGHSYGGSIAVGLAERHASRVASLVLYEPALWGTLAALYPKDPATRELEEIRDVTIQHVQAGQFERATEIYLDYWGGPGFWAATPEARRSALVDSIHTLPSGWRATFADDLASTLPQTLKMPMLILTGDASPPSARRVAKWLGDTVPSASVRELVGLGHLGPITHPSVVNREIELFLQDLKRSSLS